MVSFRMSLMRGQVDAFQRAIHDFVARLETESDDFVFLKAEPGEHADISVYEISTGEESTLRACLDHVHARIETPVRADG